MLLYCTTKNAGPAWGLEPTFMVYLGTSLDDAIAVIDDKQVREKPVDEIPQGHSETYSAIPMNLERKVLKFYEDDGWWYSIVSFDIEPSPQRVNEAQFQLF